MKHIGVGTFTATDRMRQLVNHVLDTGRISYGPLCKQFESMFAAIHESRYAVLSNSGTSSLHVALQALKELDGWQDGDEVIVPAVTFVASVNAILHNNLTPVLVDVESFYYGMHPAAVKAAITPRTRAIMPVHLFGQPCNMTALMTIARANNLRVVEDSCECMFVSHANRRTGAWGDVGCFSTYVAHLLTTGVGGVGITNDPTLAAKMRSLVNHGRDGIYISIDDGRGQTGKALDEVISRRFRFEAQGHSFRITELEAALGIPQLEDWPSMITQRQQNAQYLTEALADLGDVLQLPRIRPRTEHAFMMFPLALRHEPKSAICAYLEERGIETREMLPLTNQPVYQSWIDEAQYPIAQWINRCGFYVGCHQDLTLDDLDTIILAIRGYFGRLAVPALTRPMEVAA
jgi:dTDP-4-amino-4,6-dideoxygalactose transaminase